MPQLSTERKRERERERLTLGVRDVETLFFTQLAPIVGESPEIKGYFVAAFTTVSIEKFYVWCWRVGGTGFEARECTMESALKSLRGHLRESCWNCPKSTLDLKRTVVTENANRCCRWGRPA